MPLGDCQIITNDMLLTSSHSHVAAYVGSLALVPWRGAQHDALSPPAESGSRGRSVCGVPAYSFDPTERHRSLVTPSQSHAVSSLLHLPFFLFLVRWRRHRRSPAVCIRSPNSLCQLAVPAVTVGIHLSADVPYVWQRVAVSSIFKGLPQPRGTGIR